MAKSARHIIGPWATAYCKVPRGSAHGRSVYKSLPTAVVALVSYALWIDAKRRPAIAGRLVTSASKDAVWVSLL